MSARRTWHRLRATLRSLACSAFVGLVFWSPLIVHLLQVRP